LRSYYPPQEQQQKEQSDAFKNFINSINSPITRKDYDLVFSYFMNYCKVNSYEDMLAIGTNRIDGIIRDYIIHLRNERKLSPASVSMYLAAISHFYEMNDVMINWRKLKKFKSKHYSVVEDKPYTREQIKALVDAAPLRDKCIILLMCSAGLRRGALAYLRLKDITKIEKYGLYKVNVYKKEQEQYETFCTPECASYIDQYLDWRTRLGERIKPNSPLLRPEFDTITQVNVLKSFTTNGISSMIFRLLESTGVRPPSETGERTELMLTHGFRKFFKTSCINAGMNPLYSEYVMGHRSGLTKSYFKPTDTELLEGNDKALGYVAAINDLTINEEHRLTKKVNELQLKNDQIMELERQHKKDLEIVQNQMAQMMEMIRHNPRLAHVKPESLIKKSIS
jgi:integrase